MDYADAGRSAHTLAIVITIFPNGPCGRCAKACTTHNMRSVLVRTPKPPLAVAFS